MDLLVRDTRKTSSVHEPARLGALVIFTFPKVNDACKFKTSCLLSSFVPHIEPAIFELHIPEKLITLQNHSRRLLRFGNTLLWMLV